MRTDPNRLAELRRLLILDSSAERAYDDIARALATSLDVPIALVNMLDAQRDWFKACVGLGQSESPASASFCEAFFGTTDDMIVVEDTRTDARFATHPLVTGPPHVRFYAAARLAVAGQTLGTLCAYDLAPRKISAAQIDQLRTLTGAAIELLAQRRSDNGDGAAP